jgi:HSP20 family protein
MRDFWAIDPWQEVERLRREMGRLFTGVLPAAWTERVFPPVNIWTGRDDAVVTVELPGVDPKSIELSITGDTLALAARREADEVKEGGTYSRQERPTGDFNRTVQLPFRVEADGVEARYAKGVLTITLPRLEADKPKQIAVKATK